MVLMAPKVWSVENTKCPVSAAVMARDMVSRSLISPINSTSGDCLKADFKEAPGVTTEKLDALYDKGYDDEQIYALKKVLDID
jgi:hypothetical protein